MKRLQKVRWYARVMLSFGIVLLLIACVLFFARKEIGSGGSNTRGKGNSGGGEFAGSVFFGLLFTGIGIYALRHSKD